jgi:cytochrome P450
VAIEANARMVQYFVDAAADRAAAPRGDLISDLVAAEVDGDRLTYTEISGICALLLTAGNVTTTNLLSNLLNTLANRPDVYERLRSDRSLVPAAVEEALRIEAPVQWMGRHVTRDVVLHGVTIPKGANVLLFYGAANRDPEAVPRPDEFDLANAGQGHVAFGHGIHFCIGAPLARIEARVAIGAFLDRYERIELTEEPAIRISAAATHCGFDRLPLRLSP